ncbi:hypothetical protein ACFSUS_25515 [Spirosoma soli]|uniref:Uncharacterized protein n=1 Tax=Spirosoma soli TaxID=1770529 RepID=A0ABW5MAI9_9BACT
MKKVYLAGVSLAIFASTLLSSCDKGISVVDPIASEAPEELARSGEEAKVELAKALVKALQEKEVREFLKAEALQMYDGDYDVLYALVKDKKLASGRTFEQALAKYTTSTEYGQWAESAPLATIFVPTLSKFSPETWNIEAQTPDVVVDNSHLKGKSGKLVAFSADLRQYEVDAKQAPSFPVVVIKENERIIAKSKFDKGARKEATLAEQKSNRAISENNTHSFYFIGDYDYKKSTSKVNARSGYPRPVIDPIYFFNQYKSWYPNEPGNQRDWVYYKIWPKFNDIELVNPFINGGVDYDWSKGELGGFYYTEKLTGFKFVDAGRLQAAADWTEGYLDFHLILSFIDRNGSMQSDLKVFGCSIDQLRDNNGNPIAYDPDVELMPWDLYRYGDEWKLSFSEYDPGGSTTETITTKTTLGGNFEINGGIDIKIVKLGSKFGVSGTIERTETKTITVSQESEKLGDARIQFDYPAIVFPGGYPARFFVGAGSVEVAIEPVVKQADPRPNPYID